MRRGEERRAMSCGCPRWSGGTLSHVTDEYAHTSRQLAASPTITVQEVGTSSSGPPPGNHTEQGERERRERAKIRRKERQKEREKEEEERGGETRKENGAMAHL